MMKIRLFMKYIDTPLTPLKRGTISKIFGNILRKQNKVPLLRGAGGVFPLLAILLLPSCTPEFETIEVKNDAGQIVEKYQRHTENLMRDGLLERFDDAGKLMESEHYKNDTLHGIRTIYFENGKPQYIENYSNGKFEGEYRAFHESGELKLIGEYQDNAMQGEWKGYHPNGQLKELVQFVNNQENGAFIEYHDNGKLAAEGSYLNGDNEHGELKLYDENGELKRIMDCDVGVCKTRWKREDQE